MYRVIIAKSMTGYFDHRNDGISFETPDAYNVNEYVQDFSKIGFEVLVSYHLDEEKGE